jgi:hypothetical protein
MRMRFDTSLLCGFVRVDDPRTAQIAEKQPS